MSWFNKKEEELPPELKGKTAEQVAAELKAAQDQQVKIQEALDAKKAAEDQLTTMRDSFQVTKQRLDDIEASAAAAGGGGGGTGPTSVLEDEDRAFNERLGPVIGLAYGTAAQSARMLARQQLEVESRTKKGVNRLALFDRYSAEITETMKRVPLAQQTQVESWTNMLDLVIGRHSGELVESARKGSGDYFIEDAGGGGGEGQGGGEGDKDKISPQEHEIAEKMGITDEQYMTQKGKVFVHA